MYKPCDPFTSRRKELPILERTDTGFSNRLVSKETSTTFSHIFSLQLQRQTWRAARVSVSGQSLKIRGIYGIYTDTTVTNTQLVIPKIKRSNNSLWLFHLLLDDLALRDDA